MESSASGTQTLKLKRFDPKSIPLGATVLIIGKKHSGKSVLLVDIMWHMRKQLDLVIGMNPSEEASKVLSHFTPPCFIFDEFSDPQLHKIMEMQKGMVKQSKRDGKKHYADMAFIMDDCMGAAKNAMKSADMRDLYMLGRHRKITTINCVQYLMDMPSGLRTQIDFVIAFSDSIIANRERLYKYFFGMFSNFRDFDDVFLQCTQGYECIVMDNRKKSSDPSKCISYYKATIRDDPFIVGRSIYWRLSKMVHDRNR